MCYNKRGYEIYKNRLNFSISYVSLGLLSRHYHKDRMLFLSYSLSPKFHLTMPVCLFPFKFYIEGDNKRPDFDFHFDCLIFLKYEV